jgi:hypothetical protein
MDSSADVFSSLLATIDARLTEPPASAADTDRDSQRARLARHLMEADRVEVELHSHITQQPVTYGEASFCAECGEPAPCPTIRGLVERYEPDNTTDG